jgi:hypothetical protein
MLHTAAVWEDLMKRFLSIVVAAVVVATSLVGFQWYNYITNTQTPFDEIGIDLNTMMPAPVREYGCGRLKETFGGKTLPPYGCADETGRGWK